LLIGTSSEVMCVVQELNCDHLQFVNANGIPVGPRWTAPLARHQAFPGILIVSSVLVRYHGRVTDGSNRIFPGVGSVPVLVVPGESMEARFLSDSSSNDWGYKFTGFTNVVLQLIFIFLRRFQSSFWPSQP
jgi:hypothetical protein